MQSHLLLKLRKHHTMKAIIIPPAILQILTAPMPITLAPSSSATPDLLSKVENRLCSAKSVAESVKAAVAWILGEDGAKLVSREVAVSRNRDAQMRSDSKIASGVGNREEERRSRGADIDNKDPTHLPVRQMLEDQQEEAEDDEDEDGAADAAGWESGSVLSVESDGSPAEVEKPNTSPAKRIKPLPNTKVKAEQANLSDSDEEEPFIPVRKRVKSNAHPKSISKPPRVQSRTAITSSTFLPTLSTGFTLGDSDSDPDLDRDPDGIVGSQMPERKNRRGQRARQA